MNPLVVFFLLATAAGQSAAAVVTVNGSAPVAKHAAEFIGVNIDSASLYRRLDFKDPSLIAVSKLLAPGILRIGGGMADQLVFSPQGPQPNPDGTSNVIDAAYWDSMLAFAEATQLDLLFDLNCLNLRTAANTWNTSNAEALFTYMRAKGQLGAVFGFELGNEPAHFYKRHNASVAPDPTQLANDFATLQGLIDTYWADAASNVRRPQIIGPDLCCGFDYLRGFLSAVKPGVLDAITVHSYPFRGNKASTGQVGECTVGNFTDPVELDRSDAILGEYKLSQVSTASNTPIILGETATAGDGGCPTLSHSFSAGFFWLDQLGRTARLGFDRVFRQDLIGWSGATDVSNYMLAGNPGWVGGDNLTSAVHPDYFTTRLWKQLVGDTVLAVSGVGEELSTFRAYAACTRDGRGVVVPFLNLAPQAATVELAIGGSSALARSATRNEYHFTASALDAVQMMLNGETLAAYNQTLTPVARATSAPFTAEAYSFGFVEFVDYQTAACQAA